MPSSLTPGFRRFTETLNEEKDKRVADEALRNFVLYNNALEDEMQRMMTADKKGIPLDKELFTKMVAVKEKYMQAMYALRENAEKARHALIIFADAIQDLMTYRHIQRKQ